MATGDRHPDEPAFFKFLERDDQSSDYVRRNAELIKNKYPGSAPSLLPKLRQLYREKRRKGQ